MVNICGLPPYTCTVQYIYSMYITYLPGMEPGLWLAAETVFGKGAVQARPFKPDIHRFKVTGSQSDVGAKVDQFIKDFGATFPALRALYTITSLQKFTKEVNPT